MLNRQKLAQKLHAISDNLFLDTAQEKKIAYESWQRLVHDSLLHEKIKAIDAPWLVPDWSGSLDYTVPIIPFANSYCALAVDGSQVYPDRHEGIGCFLINIGVAQIVYGAQMPVFFSSEPTVFTGFDDDEVQDESSHDLVNCRRQEFELDVAVKSSIAAKQMIGTVPLLFLCDGSLIFWHLESKGPYLRERFMGAYMSALQQLYLQQILNAGYISLPKSKELVNLIRLELCNFEPNECVAHKQVRHILDTAITRFFLTRFTRSNVFKSTATICKYYPDHLVPYFFYIDVGSEVARIEIPAWIAQEEKLVDQVAAMALDQAIKGYGYPVSLAESHEQAVIKGPDREFFYLMLSKMSVEQKRTRTISFKSAKKRNMGI